VVYINGLVQGNGLHARCHHKFTANAAFTTKLAAQAMVQAS